MYSVVVGIDLAKVDVPCWNYVNKINSQFYHLVGIQMKSRKKSAYYRALQRQNKEIGERLEREYLGDKCRNSNSQNND